LEPYNFANYLDLAKASAQLGEPEAAEATLKLAITMQPQAADGYTALAQFYLESSRAKKARWYSQEAVRRQPTAEGYRLLASTCRLLGDTASAEAALALAGQLESERRSPPQTNPNRAAPPAAAGKQP
ncbi:MAG TPA: hypothetical protein VFV87_15220, partial [Pirellulaceae bacterium]|nr:hypothetical protein [Pirellulaceae bacterium]